jgi:curved DNA-binding protein CbpA
MNSCLCGNPADGQSALCARCGALRVLGLNTDATESEVRASYHVLVKVWHPDRFESDPTLKEAAEAKLKDVNSAYEFLSSTLSDRAESQQARSGPRAAASRSTSQKTGAASEETAADKPKPPAKKKRSLLGWVFPTLKMSGQLGIIAATLLLFRYSWIALDFQGVSGGDVSRVIGHGKESVAKWSEAPKKRFIEAVENDLRRLDLLRPAPGALPPAADAAPEAKPQSAQAAHEKPTGRQPIKTQAAAHTIYSFITVGSTRDEVLAQQGPPTASSEDKLVYGRSELFIKDNSVIGWRIDPASNPIRVKLWPQSAVDPSLDLFTYGSSKDVVLVVQGTPTAFSPDKFEYGGSEVNFRNDRVVSWKNDPASVPLRVRLP